MFWAIILPVQCLLVQRLSLKLKAFEVHGLRILEFVQDLVAVCGDRLSDRDWLFVLSGEREISGNAVMVQAQAPRICEISKIQGPLLASPTVYGHVGWVSDMGLLVAQSSTSLVYGV